MSTGIVGNPLTNYAVGVGGQLGLNLMLRGAHHFYLVMVLGIC